MTRSRACLVFGVIVLAWGGAHAAEKGCDRGCLTAQLDRYFEALAARDATRLAFAAGARFTDNGQPGTFGQKFWKVDGPPTYRLDAIDPEAQQAASNAVVMEDGRKAIVFVRLKLAERRISELETVIVRQGVGQKSFPENLSGRPILFDEDLAAAARVPRKQMADAANAYLSALSSAGTGTYLAAPLADDLVRIENGMQTGGARPDGKRSPTVAQQLEQMSARAAGVSMKVTDRRIPIVDEQKGVVLIIGLMNLKLSGPDFPGLHSVSKQERVQALIEFFKIVGGKVKRIQAVMLDLDDPAVTTTGW
jgi:hypothetical protein